MTIHWIPLVVALFLTIDLLVFAWLDYEARHAPLVDNDGHPIDENGKRLK